MARPRHSVRITLGPILIHCNLLRATDLVVDEAQVSSGKGDTRLMLSNLFAAFCSARGVLLDHVASSMRIARLMLGNVLKILRV